MVLFMQSVAGSDAVSWTAIAVAFAAMGCVAAGSFAIGKLWGAVKNGLTKTVENTQKAVTGLRSEVKDGFDSVYSRLNSLPCERHGERVDHLKEQVEHIDGTVSRLRDELIKRGAVE